MEDIETQNHAQYLARELNFADVDKLKTERISTRGTSTSSVWLATKDRNVRCFIQYDQDQIPNP